MSNQEPQNQNKTTEEAGVDKKRRRFVAGASIAAPVILTLTSPSVFGGGALPGKECYSQQMSGNASGNTPSCIAGIGPLDWLINPSWPNGFVRNDPNHLGTTADCSTWGGGTKFNDPLAFGAGAISPDKEMAAILCTYSKPNPSPSDQTLAYFVAAILNAQATGATKYVLTNDQVRGLKNGTYPPPPNMTVDQFLISTWT